MNEELTMTNVENEQEIENTELDTYEDIENCGGLIGLLVLAGSLTAAGLAAWKNKDKIKEKKNQRRIKKLEKQGYVITRPVEDEWVDISDDANEN